MTVLDRIIARLSDAQIVSALNSANAKLDEYEASKLDVNDPALRQERLLVAALREAYRQRTGEII